MQDSNKWGIHGSRLAVVWSFPLLESKLGRLAAVSFFIASNQHFCQRVMYHRFNQQL